MPTLRWLRKEYAYGYSSGDILARWNRKRRKEEHAIGGSYRKYFLATFAKHATRTSNVLEIGPGSGSWTRAILAHVPEGQVHTVDFQDVTGWLEPERYGGRLHCHTVEDNRFSCVPDGTFDIIWSFGVLCHQNAEHLREIMANTLPKLRAGGVAIHHYGDWDKLEAHGWPARFKVPASFKDNPDDEIWWPRNNPEKMARLCADAGWTVENPDLGYFERDSIIQLSRAD